MPHARVLAVVVTWGLGTAALAQGVAGGAGGSPKVVDAPGAPAQPGAPGPKKLP